MIHERRTGDAIVLSPTGALDSRSAIDFERVVLAALGRKEARFIIDLTQVDVVSSAGLRVLILLEKRLAGQGSLVLCGLSEHVREVFDVSRLVELFTITSSENEAVMRMAGASSSGTDRLDSRLAARVAALLNGPTKANAGEPPHSEATLKAVADRIARVLSRH